MLQLSQGPSGKFNKSEREMYHETAVSVRANQPLVAVF
jgi:hypothetical protein